MCHDAHLTLVIKQIFWLLHHAEVLLQSLNLMSLWHKQQNLRVLILAYLQAEERRIDFSHLGQILEAIVPEYVNCTRIFMMKYKQE